MRRTAKLLVLSAGAAALGLAPGIVPSLTAYAAFAAGTGAGYGFFATAPYPASATAASPGATLPPVPACAQPYFTYLPDGVIVVDNTQYAGPLELQGTTTVTSCTLTDESGTISFSLASINSGAGAVSCSTFSGTYVRRLQALQVNASSTGCTVHGTPSGPVLVQITGIVEYQVTNGTCCPVVTDYQAEFLLYQ